MGQPANTGRKIRSVIGEQQVLELLFVTVYFVCYVHLIQHGWNTLPPSYKCGERNGRERSRAADKRQDRASSSYRSLSPSCAIDWRGTDMGNNQPVKKIKIKSI